MYRGSLDRTEDNQWPADPWLKLFVTSRGAVVNGVLWWSFQPAVKT